MTQLRVGIVGTMMSGKTTLADTLVTQHGFKRLALADPVKDGTVEMVKAGLRYIGVDRPFTRADLERDKHVFRPVLQWFGTEFGREYVGPDTRWIDTLLQRALYFDPTPIVCDDIRFPNEVESLSAAGFVIFRIRRDEGERLKDLRARYSPEEIDGILSHPSEIHSLDLQVPYELQNSGVDLTIIAQLAEQLIGTMNAISR